MGGTFCMFIDFSSTHFIRIETKLDSSLLGSIFNLKSYKACFIDFAGAAIDIPETNIKGIGQEALNRDFVGLNWVTGGVPVVGLVNPHGITHCAYDIDDQVGHIRHAQAATQLRGIPFPCSLDNFRTGLKNAGFRASERQAGSALVFQLSR